MAKPKICYKVAVPIWRTSKYRSILACGEAKVIYIPNEWVTAPKWLAKKGYGLCVFRTLRAARKFQDYLGGTILRCEYENVLPLATYCGVDGLSYGRLDPCLSYLCWPFDTMMVEKVKVLGRVK